MTAPQLPGWRHVYSGKVRDLYEPTDGPADVVLVVASDRISAYDVILPTEIPGKGVVLTALSTWWFERMEPIIGNHLLSLDVPAAVAGRAMICRRLDMVPIECVARGYLTGSGLVEYRATSSVCGVALPEGLDDGARLPEPIFTPASKAAVGDHDENVSFEVVSARVGEELASRLREVTLAVYTRAAEISAERGILLADTKFEFGMDATGSLLLGDEVLTPDSSRYWPADQWQVGRAQPSFDKQYVRDWLTRDSGWDRASETPPPELPAGVVEATRARYLEAYERITGSPLPL
ncbi:phosphoribosylaminoimidazolesuccinocarboxamide synthase [Pseudactinotalea sp. HY158]|uniref:phosphoribosylaminoimidazolesuccinocarboxamide synthase n=1 Tax=unclassified Pseudactinotalea TaxID=2649176 RepID=UPI001E330D63|nr:phosphoribosylaminoimidazolesuccinocarboxamide synthase [Pseudactinotalea sp. HY158]